MGGERQTVTHLPPGSVEEEAMGHILRVINRQGGL